MSFVVNVSSQSIMIVWGGGNGEELDEIDLVMGKFVLVRWCVSLRCMHMVVLKRLNKSDPCFTKMHKLKKKRKVQILIFFFRFFLFRSATHLQGFYQQPTTNNQITNQIDFTAN